MTSWEELFVDREIDDAWRTFRREVTGAIEALDVLEGLDFVSEANLDHFATSVLRDVDELRVTLWWARQQPVLRAFGFRSDRRGNLVLILRPDEIDRAAAAVLLGLREGAAPVVHPSFVGWSDDAGSAWRYTRPGELPVTEQRRGTRFEIFAPLSLEDLRADVLDALAQRVNGPYSADDDGGFTLTGADGAVCFVNVRDGGAIEIWTVLAVEVQHPASVEGFQQMLPKLMDENPRFRFFLNEGAVFASQFVDGFPFVPAHVYNAVEATLELSREHRPLTDFLSELANPDEGCQPEPQTQQGLPF